MADSDDEVVDHASLLNSFGNENTNIITPVPRMHSIKPEWDEDVSLLVGVKKGRRALRVAAARNIYF